MHRNKSYKRDSKMKEMDKYLDSYRTLKTHVHVLEVLITSLVLTRNYSIDLSNDYLRKLEEEYNTEIDTVEKQYLEERLEAIRKYKEIELLISNVPIEDYRDVLRLRYLTDLEYEDASKIMHVSRATYGRLLSNALDYLTEGGFK